MIECICTEGNFGGVDYSHVHHLAAVERHIAYRCNVRGDFNREEIITLIESVCADSGYLRGNRNNFKVIRICKCKRIYSPYRTSDSISGALISCRISNKGITASV